MFGPQDLDNIEPYPANGSLEDKAVYSLEQLRQNFYWQKRNYEQGKEGGPRHAATLLAHGPKTAARMAKTAEMQFKSYLSQAYLNEQGETTDPKYPTDKMVGYELRRIRQVIVLSVANFMYYFESMMPEEVRFWNRDIVFYNLDCYRYRYVDTIYEDINVVIPKKKLPPPSAHELHEHLSSLSTRIAREANMEGVGKDFLVSRIRDDIIQFLLVDIPFNNKRLEEGTKLIADEVMKTETDDKPVIH